HHRFGERPQKLGIFARHAGCLVAASSLHQPERWCVVAHVVTEPCVNCKYTDCVVVCPCECFYGDDRQLYIDPEDCIDCGACIPECPVEAIYPDAGVPAKWVGYVQLNADRVKVLKPAGAHVTERLPPK